VTQKLFEAEYYERSDFAGVRQLQIAQLHHHQKQEGTNRQIFYQEVLSEVPRAHRPQGRQDYLMIRGWLEVHGFLFDRAQMRARTLKKGSVALIGRASDSKSEGSRFESWLARQINVERERLNI
jgi:hypothetical protein